MEADKKNFTFLESFIIMVILGIVASVVMPKFTVAASEAKTAQLCDALHDVRSQITLYKVQHKGSLPGWGNTSWLAALTSKTNSAGDLFTEQMKDADEPCWGPYLDEIPYNVFNEMNTVRIDGPAAGQGTHGWRYDSFKGEFQADDP